MNEQTINISELLILTLYLGSITFLLGAIFQTLTAYYYDKKIKLKILPFILITRVLTISISLLIWFIWTTKIDIMFGPLLLPGLFAELILSPTLLKIFGYKLSLT